MCLLLFPYFMNKKKQSDRAKAAGASGSETAYAPRPVADGYANNPSSHGQHGMGQARPMGVSSG
ncbi:uncharacterized protein N7496_003511 [Penicillium cataractarum]|uniref:Uncharacterized protein n=1 Tax=Penicillium cataractarum TaxID=2100454 RepID=A0A9W9VG93_9EURO|nr:uncharacterized protein N7496_003511 [Penicillium cataractarum]KAJ5381083.1 hypothetical protein N7496_003511 [Penicillium cataractarum]